MAGPAYQTIKYYGPVGFLYPGIKFYYKLATLPTVRFTSHKTFLVLLYT